MSDNPTNMDKKTYEALRTVMAYIERRHPDDHPDMIYKEMQQVYGWMGEVEKEINDHEAA